MKTLEKELTNEQILKQAIEKAVANGLNLNSFGEKVHKDFDILFCDIITDRYFSDWNCYNFIFSHDFAKAFWGERYICCECKTERDVKFYCPNCLERRYHSTWQHHLQQMVLEKEPLQYLVKFL